MKSFMVGVAVVLLSVVAGVIFFWPSQRTGAEPINFGRDVCAHCRMHISQPGFAAELRDTDGVLTKYDDVGCMLQALAAMHRAIPEAWVEDHDGAGFVPLLTAHLVRTDAGGTPMGYGIVAFATEAAATAYARAYNGQVASLEDILKDPGRLAQRPRTTAQAGNRGTL